MPFFSIIIPTYNSALCLQNAINSIAGQTFSDYEVIFVDGASADNTIILIEAFKSLHQKKVEYVSERDQGIYDAMNKGIGIAKGDWLYFLGSDDTLYSTTVLSQISSLIKTEHVDLIYGNVLGMKSNYKYIYDSETKVFSEGIHHQSIFYNRNIFNFTGKYDLEFTIAADYHLTLKVFCNSLFKTKYVNVDIANFGEAGLSSAVYDYKFFSYHYRFLATRHVAEKMDNPLKCLLKSIYCCHYLVKEKTNTAFAWRNMLYYILRPNRLGFLFRIRTLLTMMKWSIKSVQ